MMMRDIPTGIVDNAITLRKTYHENETLAESKMLSTIPEGERRSMMMMRMKCMSDTPEGDMEMKGGGIGGIPASQRNERKRASGTDGTRILVPDQGHHTVMNRSTLGIDIRVQEHDHGQELNSDTPDIIDQGERSKCVHLHHLPMA